MGILSRSFELKFISKDENANGETDFKGETSTLSTEDRIRFLSKYAAKMKGFYQDVSLDTPIVTLDAARERLKKIKPQPLPKFRKRIQLEDWKWIGYSDEASRESPETMGEKDTGKEPEGDEGQAPEKMTEQKPGKKMEKSLKQSLKIPVQDFRCLVEWELVDTVLLTDCAFELGDAAQFDFDPEGKLSYVSDGIRYEKGSIFSEYCRGCHKLKVELDFVCRRWKAGIREHFPSSTAANAIRGRIYISEKNLSWLKSSHTPSFI